MLRTDDKSQRGLADNSLTYETYRTQTGLRYVEAIFKDGLLTPPATQGHDHNESTVLIVNDISKDLDTIKKLLPPDAEMTKSEGSATVYSIKINNESLMKFISDKIKQLYLSITQDPKPCEFKYKNDSAVGEGFAFDATPSAVGSKFMKACSDLGLKQFKMPRHGGAAIYYLRINITAPGKFFQAILNTPAFEKKIETKDEEKKQADALLSESKSSKFHHPDVVAEKLRFQADCIQSMDEKDRACLFKTRDEALKEFMNQFEPGEEKHGYYIRFSDSSNRLVIGLIDASDRDVKSAESSHEVVFHPDREPKTIDKITTVKDGNFPSVHAYIQFLSEKNKTTYHPTIQPPKAASAASRYEIR